MADARRFPNWVFGHGEEPDPRFTLANERTFLAWTRTALALVAGGVALEALALPIQPGLLSASADILLVLGLVIAPMAWLRWALTERAAREGRPLPGASPSALLAVGMTVVAVLLTVGTLL
ncbi:MAG TPA: DUF202 domain-containing protein [Amnibacterium sp.]|jgi:putative membrane protein|uniref:YidH family protein n=1 Tax=Amnibacterium sp. TaxID=1872496 RepID=UPI002F931162